MTVLLGTLPGMMPFSCPSSGVDTEDRRVTVVDTGAGAYAMQSPHRGRRAWRLETSVATPDEQAALRQLLRYSSDPLVFVSEAASGINGLTPAQSACDPSVLPTGVSRGGSELVQDGRGGTFRVAWTAGTTLSTEWVLDGPPCPVIPGEPLTISAGLRRSAFLGDPVRLGVEWVSASGITLGRDMADVLVSSTQPLVRAHRTLTAPLTARSARMVFRRATQVAAPALTLTSSLAAYGEGDGAPEVVAMSSAVTHGMITPGQTFGAYDLVLEEVGLALR